jgi:uncharacterized protein YgiM (DUF1202 family)
MLIDKTWKNQMLDYIKSKYKNKGISLNIAEEQLEHNWINPKNSLYDKNTSTVSIYKIMLVKENLKLRSAEATSTQVLTVMQAGTKVKILELGKSETIDGINSNWVKVEVQAGAKDRDGRAIRAGTLG